MTVLIVTHSDDHRGIDRVIEHLADRSVAAVRLDTDRFPHSTRLVVLQGAAGRRCHLVVDGECHDLDAIDAIWYRRLRAPTLPDDMDARFKGVAAAEARAVVLGLLNASPAFALDPWHRVRRADHKQRQLDLAAAVGLAVPPTLTTNDPEAARAFAARCPDGVVAKMLSSFSLPGAGGEQVVFTNALDGADLAALDGLRLCPMVFQARIDRVRELRCTIVGHEVFCAALEARDSAAVGDDWRRGGGELAASWTPHRLPADVRDRLLALATRAGLNYGAADLLVDADGTHWFLEMNPVGEYQWLETACELPINAAIADVLADPARRRV